MVKYLGRISHSEDVANKQYVDDQVQIALTAKDDVNKDVQAHVSNTSNPHGVTKSQVGLGNVDDIKQASKVEFDTHNADTTKHITASERTAWNNKQEALGFTAENTSNKGQAGGYASLDDTGRVPVSQLPDFEGGEDKYAGKIIVNLGDSIIEATNPSISDVIADELGSTTINGGFGGCMMCPHPNEEYAKFSMTAVADAIATENWSIQENATVVPAAFKNTVTRLKAVNWTQVYCVVISYGTNDWLNSNPLDNSSDKYDKASYLGALRYSVKKLLQAYPNLKILVTAPIFRSTNDRIENSTNWENGSGLLMSDYVEGLNIAGKEIFIPIADTFFGLGLNAWNESFYFPANDGTHPNAIGRQLLGQKIANEINLHYGAVRTKKEEREIVFRSEDNTLDFVRNHTNTYLESMEVALQANTTYILETDFPGDMWVTNNLYFPTQSKVSSGVSSPITTEPSGNFGIVARPAKDLEGTTYQYNATQIEEGVYTFIIRKYE